MNKIYIIDAVNFLFRSYYAIGTMTNALGQSTNALFGFVRSLQKILRDFSPDYAVCVFDGPENKKSRQAVYAAYKAHREGAPADLFPQFDWAYEYCALAGIPTLCIDGVEADDAMAAIAVWAEKQGANVYLCSSDKDLMQLVNDHIFLLHVHKDNLLVDAKKVEEIYNVRPDQMLDLLAIMGDTSDNIPGLEGFGPKTAAALLKEFGTLDQILAHPEKIKGEKKQEILRTQKEIALMSRELATLDINLDVPKKEEFYRLKSVNLEKLSDFFHRMNFNSLLREVKENKGKRNTDIPGVIQESGIEQEGSSDFLAGTRDIAKGKDRSEDEKYEASGGPNGASPEGVRKPPQPAQGSPKNASFFGGANRFLNDERYKLQYHLVDSEKELLLRLNEQKEVCISLETTADLQEGSPLLAKLSGIAFSYEPGEAWYIPYNEQVEAGLRSFFAKANCGFCGHNIKYILHVLKNFGITLPKISFDTLLASYLLSPQNRRHNLDDLILEVFKKIKESPCEEVDYICRLKEHFEEELKEKKLEKLFYEIEIPLTPILMNMERTGIYLDREALQSVGKELNHNLHQIKATIFREVGEEFNLNSPKQLGVVLFEKLKLKSPKKLSTSADVLEELAIECPLVQEILNYRALEKLRSTYAESLPDFINPNTGRIHCTFNQSGTATGRLACQDPNLQNIPVRSAEGLAIRACFKPEDEGWVFLGADYSQIELRLLAHFSEDPELLKAFLQGEDIHTHTASIVFGVAQKEVTLEMRSQAKTVNFGILYGQSPFGLSRQLGISVHDASAFIKTYFERYPRVFAYLEHCKELTRKTGLAKTLTGRQRPIPEIHNKNPAIRAGAERLAINTPLQGTAADLIKMAMIAIDRSLTERQLKGKMILQIHDELIFEIPKEETPIFEKLVKEKMEHVLQLRVPIEVHLAVGKNWAEC